MFKPLFQGSAPALVTPFTATGLNLPVWNQLIDHHLAKGAAALVIAGTTGEPAALTSKEWEALVDHAVQRVNGRVPVIVGTGGNDTPSVIAAARRGAALGADAQLCVTPYYNKTSQSGLVAHYSAIADQSPLPLILYNVPARTGLSLQPEALARLAEHEHIIGVKEASGDVTLAVRMLALCRDRLAFYSGCDQLTQPLMALGFQGVISVAANIIPEKMAQLTRLALAGEWQKAAALQLDLCDLMDALFMEVNPIPVKCAMRLMGWNVGPLRLPLCDLSAEQWQKLQAVLRSHQSLT